MKRAQVSRTVTKNSFLDASYEGDMKFVPPYQSGHVTVPVSVGSCSGSTRGLPSGPISFAQVVFTNGLPRRNSPVARSFT